MTQPLYIASVGSFAGKSLAALVLGHELIEAGHAVGYFKPLGTLPHTVDGIITDEDAYFISGRLNPTAPLDAICPVLLTEELRQRALASEVAGLPERILDAYRRIAAERDFVLVGGVGGLSRGSLLGLSAPQVAELLDARVLLLAKFASDAVVEEVLLAKHLLGERMFGVIFNFVGPDQRELLDGPLGHRLAAQNIPVLGALDRDDLLAAITVRELAEELPAKLLCCEASLEGLIVHFVIGAMGVASASRYFRQVSDKAVITGGDRADIQLAALQTATKAIVLTGNIHPSPPIVVRAQELGVPMLLAPYDTLKTVERIESITARLRVREQVKIERARAQFRTHVALARIVALATLT